MPSDYIRRKLKELLDSDDLVSMYIEKYGELVSTANVNQLKEHIKKLKNNANKEAEEQKDGDDPIFETNMRCPACYRKDVIHYSLRAKSQVIKETIFLVPQYSGVSGYFAVDFNLLQTTVCPECMFASPDPRDWTRINSISGAETPSQLLARGKFMQELRNTELDRKNIFPEAKADVNYFARPRSYSRAIEATKLSILRAELEMQYLVPAVNYKIAWYNLKIADIEKKQGKDNKETLKVAEKFFSTAVEKSDCPTVNSEMESIYEVVALNMYLGDRDKAASFIKIAKDAVREKESKVKENPTSETKKDLTDADKWEKRIGTLWENRDDESFWKNNL